ncbi:MAG: UDP-N-acetylmuramoyl-L-alanyl-D-glutamate--2,6-diaminopimelate ligase [Oscillospiraceae bacterium]|nr:UDP-N-acetylmuramoyl-L-alanyl-D-glutamate--2,6-diaminopimelate ligase [Oscillospiraceae bacterium]
MKLSQILKTISVRELHAPAELEITGVEYDSRAVKPGALFVAVKGLVSDGHAYIPAAVKAGAAAVLCMEKPDCDVPYIIVEDTRAALAEAAANFFGRPADSLRIVGVTGTNGKTTVSMLIKNMIEYCTGEKAGLIGTNGAVVGDRSLHTDNTTPESRDLHEFFSLMVAEGCRWCVMEVSSHSLVMGRVAGLHFASAVFTNLTQDHLDFHKTMESYAQAKAILFGMCDTAAVNADDPAGAVMLEAFKGSRAMTFSPSGAPADICAEDVRLGSDRVMFTARSEAGRVPMSLGIPGAFSVANALAAACCGMALGLDLTDISMALTTCRGVKGRAEVVPTGKDFSVLIDYACTPDATENILETVRGYAEGRVIIVFGCGGDRDRGKRPLMGAAAGRLADVVFVTSDNPRTEDPEAIIDEIMPGLEGARAEVHRQSDRRLAISEAMHAARAGDVVILAGKGHEDYQIIGREKRHMDEREIVADVLARWDE